jgi:hypothetical protein
MLNYRQLANQTPTPTHQCYYAGAKSAVKPFYVSYMSFYGVLSLPQKTFCLLIGAASYTTDNTHYPFHGNLLDHLDYTYMLPALKMWTAAFACENRNTKHLLYSCNVSRETINAEQQWAIESTIVYLLYQMGYQIPIPALAYHATQPKTGGYCKSHSQPGYTTLMLYPCDAIAKAQNLICLNLPQVSGLLNQMLMNLLTVLPSAALPESYCAFIQTEGSYYSWNGTTICQKCYHLSHKLHRISKVPAYAGIEHCAFTLCKCLAASMTYVSFLLAAMNANVTTIRFSSCRTVWIVAEYFTGIHDLTPFIFGV